MHPSEAQDSSSLSKQSVDSDSSSSANMDSEHADAIGTPMIVAMSDSEVQETSVPDEQVGEQVVQVKVSTDTVKNGTAPMDGKASSSSKPRPRRILTFPEKVISCIIEHAFQLGVRDPVYAPLSREQAPFWRYLYSGEPLLCTQLDYRWNILKFASWLKDVQEVDDTWTAAVENHPFWATFLSLRPSFVRESDMGSSRSHEPTWRERAQPGRKEAKTHSSLQAEAENTCWVCVLHYGPVGTRDPPLSQTYIETTPFRAIPVCKKHYEADMCHCCLRAEPDINALQLTRQQDNRSFGFDDWASAFVCKRCRHQAIDKAYNEYPIRFRIPPNVPSSYQQYYLDLGQGNARAVIEHMYAVSWAVDYLQLELEYAEETKRWKNLIKNDYLRRGQNPPSLANAKLPLDQSVKLFENSIQWGVDRMIDEGMWISPRTLNDKLEKAIATGMEEAIADALPTIHVYDPPINGPTVRQRTITPTTDWPIKDRPAPSIALHKMQRDYMSLLPDRVEGTMKNLKTMIAKMSNGNMDVAEAKATSMGIDELLTWLNDPRNHIPNWWHNQPFVKPITSSDLARVFSSKSPESESGAKRKREDSDSSGEEKVDKVAKKVESKPTPTLTANASAETEMDVTTTSAGPATPSGARQTSSPPSRNETSITLAMLTPEKVNRLPWPTPQETLTTRECEYLRMTGFNEKKISWELQYAVPAYSSELDEITKEILMQVWQNVTRSFLTCRCAICQRAREYEKQVVAAEANPQYSEYISLLTSDTKTEDMTDHQRSWLANQALLLHSAVTLADEDYDELPITDDEEEMQILAARQRDAQEMDSDDPYELYGSDEEMLEEAQGEDDVSYDIPGARLQENRR